MRFSTIPLITVLMLAGMMTLFTSLVLGATDEDIWHFVPLALTAVVAGWLSNDLIVILCRRSKIVSALFLWPQYVFTSRATQPFQALFIVLPVMLTASLLPAWLCWQAGYLAMFNDWIHPLPFSTCLISCLGNEFLMMMIYPSAPSGFVHLVDEARRDMTR